jgi:hypothetical protein
LKKLRAVFVTGVLLLMVVTSAQAVTWDVSAPQFPTPKGDYQIPTTLNGGYFWVPPPVYFIDDRGSGNSSTSTDLLTTNNPASAINPIDFGNPSVSMEFKAMSGGEVLPDGLSNAGYAEITHSGVTGDYGVATGHQRILSDTFRNFIPDGWGTITVTADLAADIAWDVYGYDWVTDQFANDGFDPYSGYRLHGEVTVNAFSVSKVEQVSTGTPIVLDNGTLTGSLQFDPVADSDIYYVMHVSLLIDTYIQNTDPMFGPDWLPGQPMPAELRIGTALAPLELTAVVSQNQVPIPPSLILLLSGVGGLVAIRRRVTGA